MRKETWQLIRSIPLSTSSLKEISMEVYMANSHENDTKDRYRGYVSYKATTDENAEIKDKVRCDVFFGGAQSMRSLRHAEEVATEAYAYYAARGVNARVTERLCCI